ncbi:uncharacterized protein LOC135212263 [Macrobrachium nipponense]|uniref:uncharacterized protein LOC135212263 n=1 Tax=Macrobrachium nipponense TaxID=159736 RepID=UPI0030C89095
MGALALLFGVAAFFATGGTANFQQELAIWSQDLKPGYVIETSIVDGRKCHCKVPGSTVSSTLPTTTIITTTVTTSTILLNSTTSTTPEETTTTPDSTTSTSSTVISSTSTTPVPTSSSTTTKPDTTTSKTSTTTEPATTTTSTSTTTKPDTTTATSTSTTTKPATTTTSTSTTTKPATTTTSTSTTTKPATTTTSTSTTTKPATTTTSTSTTTKPATTTTSTSTTTKPTTTTTSTSSTTTTPKKTTQASGGCGSCSEDIHLNLDNYNAETFTLHWKSPNYPNYYPDGCTCVLNVYLENPGTVDISFSSDSKIYDDSNCNYDRLVVEGDISNPDTLCDVYISNYGALMMRMDDTELSFTATFYSVSGDSDRQEVGFDMNLLITLWDIRRSLKDIMKERVAHRKELLLARNVTVPGPILDL